MTSHKFVHFVTPPSITQLHVLPKPIASQNTHLSSLVSEQTRYVIIQWESELRTSLDFEWSKRGWVVNGPYFEWDLKSISPHI